MDTIGSIMKNPLNILLAAVAVSCGLLSSANAQTGTTNFAPPPGIQKYSFWPQGGNFWGDLYPVNFVDLNAASPAILAYNGGDYTYDGHQGVDAAILNFTAQEIGVPIFAALDGAVIATHDGEPDMNTAFNNAALDNYVMLDHGNGQTTTYQHMRKGSVPVVMGEQVYAGQQIGYTASSGYSTGPHLHLQSEVNNQYFESFAGTDRTGLSGWVAQPAFRSDLYLLQFVITDQNLSTWQGWPYDTTRKGTFYTGLQSVNFWFQLGNAEGISSITINYLRPDGSTAVTNTSPISNAARNAALSFDFDLNLDVTGTWKIQLVIDGATLAEAPFNVVAPGTPIVNHPPGAVTAAFDPAKPTFTNATFCRITSDTVFLDPDYDFVRYHYVWKVNDTVVRDTISAGMADAISHDLASPGDTVTCTVTPGDGTADGPATTVTTAVTAGTPLLNISTRLDVGTSDNVLIGGFIISGTQSKQVIVRGLGPSLASAGVSGVLTDPVLELHKPDGTVITNDNWKDMQEAAIMATGIAPTNDKESAIIATLAPGAYTAVLSGSNGGTGVGLVEAYDLDQAASAQLANISTRGFVQTADNVMIGGFILGGTSGNSTVVVRGIGPSLASAGVSGTLADPTLTLHNSNGAVVATNNDWAGGPDEQTIYNDGLAPTNAKESAILATLAPGAYTAVLSGVGGTSGVGLVEVYNLQ